MFKKFCSLMILSFASMSISSFLVAEIDYEIKDIGTLQTHSSQAIALNNHGQILGWYNIDGSNGGKRFFVRNRDGSFHEIVEDSSIVYENVPRQFISLRIDWRYILDDGRVYGTFDMNPTYPVLYMWDPKSGIVKLGTLPGRVSAINNSGKVLIESVAYDENGKSIRRPVIWENGNITKLRGLMGEIGIESEESYGYDMNNKGDVVGQSTVYLSYKNNLYKQICATKWIDGTAINMHNQLPKIASSSAKAINDLGEIFLTGSYLLKENGDLVHFPYGISNVKLTNRNFVIDLNCHGFSGVFDKNKESVIDNSSVANKFIYDKSSIWRTINGIVSANDNGQVIANGITVYGEQHAMLLNPVYSK